MTNTAPLATDLVVSVKKVAAPQPAVKAEAVKAVTKPVAKTVVKPAPKAAQKAAAKPAEKSAAKKPATKKVAAPAKPKAPKPAKVVKAAKAAKEKKPKLMRDSFTIPKAEYAVIDVLKDRAGKVGSPVKKSELLRAGIKALAAMTDAALLAALKAVPAIKTGRPAKA